MSQAIARVIVNVLRLVRMILHLRVLSVLVLNLLRIFVVMVRMILVRRVIILVGCVLRIVLRYVVLIVRSVRAQLRAVHLIGPFLMMTVNVLLKLVKRTLMRNVPVTRSALMRHPTVTLRRAPADVSLL